MPTLRRVVVMLINTSKDEIPDNGVKETLNGGVPWERSVLDVPVASVVLPDDEQHRAQCDHGGQMLDACQ